jgi:general secretion pathway protein K
MTVCSGQWVVGSRQSAVGSGVSRIVRPRPEDSLSGTDSRLPTIDCRLQTDSGVILIALLWVLVALSVIALSFSRESFVEVAAARNAQSLENAYFIARAGIASTVYQLMQKRMATNFRQVELQDTPDPLDLGSVTGSFGGGVYRVDIQDESGKINVNTVSEGQLRALVEASGIGTPDADIISDSILDWRDADTAHRLNGAEDDYYGTLNPPYKAKNGRLDTVEELLLVRGVTADYFFGHPERAPDGSVFYRYGLSRYFTVYSTRSQVNVNYAPLPVLLSIPGMPPEAAKMIYDRRHTKPFKNLEDIIHEIPVPLGAATLPYLTTAPTGIYTLMASAQAANSRVRRVIRTVISLEPGERTQYRTLYWNENAPNYEGITP